MAGSSKHLHNPWILILGGPTFAAMVAGWHRGQTTPAALWWGSHHLPLSGVINAAYGYGIAGFGILVTLALASRISRAS